MVSGTGVYGARAGRPCYRLACRWCEADDRVWCELLDRN